LLNPHASKRKLLFYFWESRFCYRFKIDCILLLCDLTNFLRLEFLNSLDTLEELFLWKFADALSENTTIFLTNLIILPYAMLLKSKRNAIRGYIGIITTFPIYDTFSSLNFLLVSSVFFDNSLPKQQHLSFSFRTLFLYNFLFSSRRRQLTSTFLPLQHWILLLDPIVLSFFDR